MDNIEVDTSKIYLVTGAAGFIGYFLSKSLLEKGCRVIGVDNLNDYYDPNLKHERLKRLKIFKEFEFIREDISDKEAVCKIFNAYRPGIVIHLAAQAGVRYSLVNPDSYIRSNLVGFYHILEACRQYPVSHLVYASSSSVYGLNENGPFLESDCTDNPVSLYAATKKSNELMAYAYSYLYQIPVTGLRFFTVYGPLGRPDMSYFAFTNSYFADEPITIFSGGDDKNEPYRDFTYIDDIVEGIEKIVGRYPTGIAPHNVYNIGNSSPESLIVFIQKLEKSLSEATGKEVAFKKQYQPMQLGDVTSTFASVDRINDAVGFVPKTSVEQGLKKFASWYVKFYDIC
jgi:UDP-glucuronate 4-epimerase